MSNSPGGGQAERLGHFQLVRILGTGGFATVWLARDEMLEADVAIKVLAENWAHSPDIRQRFTGEARILWHTESPNIVRVYGVDTADDGRPYFVMEYAEGGSLESRMRDRLAAGDPYSVDEAVVTSVAIARGLAAAQDRGIIHRDLKPSNVLFKVAGGGDERILIADFGIARSLEAAGATTIAAGTPHYMAPEQTEGRADKSADVYSAAVILFELLAGKVPFPFNSVGQVIRAQLTQQAPAITDLRRDVPASIANVLARGLRADPDQRQASAAEWLADLLQAADGDDTAAAPAAVDAGATLGPDDIAAARAAGGAVPISAMVGSEVGALGGGSTEAAGGRTGPSAVGAGAAPAPPPPPPPPPAPPTGHQGGSGRRRRILAAVAAILILAGVLTGISLASAGKATAEVFRVPATASGPHPFSRSFTPARLLNAVHFPHLKPAVSAFSAPAGAPSNSIPAFAGSTPGLYGGTRQLSVCDAAAMVRYLLANPNKLGAWAGVEGIATSAVPTYIGGLTGIILRADTRVTNHGFVNGQATTIPEVLQAGTAVLVDSFGVPRARCYCGNPLTAPVALPNVRYVGPSWSGFSPSTEAVIQAAQALTKLVLVDAQTGIPFLRPVGSDGAADTDAPPGALAGSPFAAPTSTTSSTTTSSTPRSSTTTSTPSTTSTTAAAQPVDVTRQGTVSASSTYSGQYPASNAVDGDPTTSWFSAGAGDGPNSTYTWQGTKDQMITRISITGNEHDADPSTRDHFGYGQTEVQVLNSSGAVVFDQTYPGPSDSTRDITATPNATGNTVRLLLMNREDPSCGGFAELQINAVPS